MSKDRKKSGIFHVKRYIISGIVTLIPLLVTWILFEFIFRQLSKIGLPWVRMISRSIRNDSPAISQWLLAPWFQNILAALIVLIALYLLGWAVNRVLGKRIIGFFESLFRRLPLVRGVYNGVKQLIAVLQHKPSETQRVVLIDFPSSDMKTVGLVTRSMIDRESGEKLVAVYVPTTPNPTNGYLEIVPVDHVVSTDWTVDQAMNFIISGGTVGPEEVNYGYVKKAKKSKEEIAPQ